MEETCGQPRMLDVKLDALSKLMDERFETSKIALGLQAKEYERRLEALNGEAERFRNIQTTYLPREVYDVQQAKLADEVRSLSEFRANAQGRQVILTIGASALVSIAVGLLVKLI